ncbi:MAG: hypothetical protein CL484_06270 [Acidobacteria bacterium]|nr:hypothetical protein [Acidobacteriota bacterium]|tara:strand:- start:668 stop:1273 length:606 start_codon:yes stop_codon:yes gene_type:complete
MDDDYGQSRRRQFRDVREIRHHYRELSWCSLPNSDEVEALDGIGIASSHRANEIMSERELRWVRYPEEVAVRNPEDAFSDEIDIDFPAVSNLVDRMRRSFFGAGQERTFMTEVSLTSAQANTGTKVPLDISLHHSCPVCGGRGEIWLERCSACAGSGAGLLPHHLQLLVPPGVRHGTRLGFDITPPCSPPARVRMRVLVQP